MKLPQDVGYHGNRLDEPVLMAGPKLLLVTKEFWCVFQNGCRVLEGEYSRGRCDFGLSLPQFEGHV